LKKDNFQLDQMQPKMVKNVRPRQILIPKSTHRLSNDKSSKGNSCDLIFNLDFNYLHITCSTFFRTYKSWNDFRKIFTLQKFQLKKLKNIFFKRSTVLTARNLSLRGSVGLKLSLFFGTVFGKRKFNYGW